MAFYATLQGDTWDIIAKKHYGNEKQIDILIRANTKYIDTVIFSSGITLTIPDEKQETDSKESDNSIPAWRL